MIRKLSGLALSAMLFSFAAVYHPVPTFAQMSESTANVTGDWAVQMTGIDFAAGTLHLSQVGDTVVGSALASKNESGVLQFSGKLQGNKMSGNWRGPKGETGWLTFNFSPEHRAFNGEWGYGGRPPSGHIVSRKIRTTAF